MRRTATVKLDGTNRGDLSITEICILSFQIDDQLTHSDGQRSVMIFSLRFGRSEETDHPMRIKGISGPTQAPFCQTCFLRSFSRRNAIQDDRAPVTSCSS